MVFSRLDSILSLLLIAFAGIFKSSPRSFGYKRAKSITFISPASKGGGLNTGLL